VSHNIPVRVKAIELTVEAVNDEQLPWEQFLARCRDAGYEILEERPEQNSALIGRVHDETGW